jgi:hypothetical protein
MISQHEIPQLILCIGFHGLGLLARFVAQNFHLLFCPSFRSVHALSNFYCTFFLLSPIHRARSQVLI